MQRRGFLLAVLAGGGVGAIAGTLGVARHRVHVAGQLRFILADEEGARRVGLLYLSQNAAERDPQVLADLLVTGIAWPALIGGDALGLIDERVRRDFASGDVVELQGWILSRTEARLCALAALDAPA